jgi:hypothetical protein
MADQLLSEKVKKEFPDFVLDKVTISEGAISLSNDDSDIELLYNSDENTFALRSIKFKPTMIVLVDNQSLKDVHISWAKGSKKVE